MNSEIIEKIDEIISLLKDSKDIKEFYELKEKIINNKELLKKIEEVKNDENKYSKNYIDKKKEIIELNDFKEYKIKEKELYMLVQSINIKLKSLIEE